MTRFALIVVLCLLAGATYATFEIADPATQINDELEKDTEEQEAALDDGEDSWGESANRGIGSTPCTKYLLGREEGSDSYITSVYWLRGFVNLQFESQGVPGLSTDQDTELMALWVENHCLKNPLDSLAQAAEGFVEEYSKS